jgi:hypothetical protein
LRYLHMIKAIRFDSLIIEPGTVTGFPFQSTNHTELCSTSTSTYQHVRYMLEIRTLTMSYGYSLPLIPPLFYSCNTAATRLLLLQQGVYWSLHLWGSHESHAIYCYINSTPWFYIDRIYHIFYHPLYVCFLV